MSFRPSLLTLLTTLLLGLLAGLFAAPAHADEQRLVYDLLLGEKVVGSREVTIRYIQPQQPGDPQIRLVDSTTKLDPGGPLPALHSRMTARVGSTGTSFVASTRTGQGDQAETVEIQARQAPDGTWLVTAITRGKIQEMSYRKTEVDLTAADLLDPERYELFTQARGSAEVLLPQTGTILQGPVKDEGEATISVGGQSVLAHRYSWRPQVGKHAFAWNQDGLLVSATLTVAGRQLQARLRQMPPARSWGEVQVGTDFTEPGSDIGEQEL